MLQWKCVGDAGGCRQKRDDGGRERTMGAAVSV